MDTWNRQTDLRGEGRGGDWKILAKERIRIHAQPTDTHDNVKAGRRGLGEGGQGEEMVNIGNSAKK